MTALVAVGADGSPATTSLIVSSGTGNEHASVIRLIRDNVTDFEEFGRVGFEIAPFETAGGTQERTVAVLNEEQATLLLTYMRNNDVVREFKKRLVRDFYEMRRQIVPAIPQTYAEALRAAADQADRADRAESKVVELSGPASSWNELAESVGDYAVSDAAKVLSRDPNIDIKERALFQFMSGLQWVFKRDGRWKAYRTQLDTGRLAEKVGRPYWHEGRGETVAGDATVRITPKGLQELHRRLGGSGQLALVVSA